MPLGPFFGPPFERNSTSIFSFELRNWIQKGPDGGRTDTHDFLGPPLHNKPFGQKTSDLATFLWGGRGRDNRSRRKGRRVVKKINSRHSQNIFKNTSSHVRSEEKSGKMLPDKMKGRSWDTDIACRDTYIFAD